ncbi:MAG: asparaginase [Elusimicrobiota bacterium]|jgi:L-asparaginase|nr:asparaginase [Elusimicrobiota bacterium]
MAVRIIATGGTFDKEYNEITGELFFTKTHLREILTLGRCKLPVSITPLMMIDSLYMTDKHRAEILRACKKCDEKNLVITHGTDTMEITAKYLGNKIKNKTIVLTGAMIPYKFGASDGIFNLASALSFAQVLPAGVYVAMNGKLFQFDNVIKNKRQGVFETKN